MRRPIVVAALVALLASCMSERVQVATAAQTRMVGLTKAALLACAGPPHEATSQGDLEILSFDVSEPAEPGVPASPPAAAARAAGTGQTGATAFHLGLRAKHCIARVTVVGDRVRRVSYVSSAGLPVTDLERCAAVVEACVR
jgi:hypothetical protein